MPDEIVFNGVVPVLAVPDVNAALEYYERVFGFDVSFRYQDPPSHAGMCRG